MATKLSSTASITLITQLNWLDFWPHILITRYCLILNMVDRVSAKDTTMNELLSSNS